MQLEARNSSTLLSINVSSYKEVSPSLCQPVATLTDRVKGIGIDRKFQGLEWRISALLSYLTICQMLILPWR